MNKKPTTLEKQSACASRSPAVFFSLVRHDKFMPFLLPVRLCGISLPCQMTKRWCLPWRLSSAGVAAPVVSSGPCSLLGLWELQAEGAVYAVSSTAAAMSVLPGCSVMTGCPRGASLHSQQNSSSSRSLFRIATHVVRTDLCQTAACR